MPKVKKVNETVAFKLVLDKDSGLMLLPTLKPVDNETVFATVEDAKAAANEKVANEMKKLEEKQKAEKANLLQKHKEEFKNLAEDQKLTLIKTRDLNKELKQISTLEMQRIVNIMKKTGTLV
jgi:hypothetical protein